MSILEKALSLTLDVVEKQNPDLVKEAEARLEAGKQSLSALLYGDGARTATPSGSVGKSTLAESFDAVPQPANPNAAKRGKSLLDLAPSFGQRRPQIRAALDQFERAQSQLAQGASIEKVSTTLEPKLGQLLEEAGVPRELFPRNPLASLIAKDTKPKSQQPTTTTKDKKDSKELEDERKTESTSDERKDDEKTVADNGVVPNTIPSMWSAVPWATREQRAELAAMVPPLAARVASFDEQKPAKTKQDEPSPDKQADTQIKPSADKQTKQADKQSDKQTKPSTEKQVDKQTDKQTKPSTEKQADKQTDKQTKQLVETTPSPVIVPKPTLNKLKIQRFAKGTIAKFGETTLDIGVDEENEQPALVPQLPAREPEAQQLGVTLPTVTLPRQAAYVRPRKPTIKKASLDSKSPQVVITQTNKQQANTARTTSDQQVALTQTKATQSFKSSLDRDQSTAKVLTQKATQPIQLKRRAGKGTINPPAKPTLPARKSLQKPLQKPLSNQASTLTKSSKETPNNKQQLDVVPQRPVAATVKAAVMPKSPTPLAQRPVVPGGVQRPTLSLGLVQQQLSAPTLPTIPTVSDKFVSQQDADSDKLDNLVASVDEKSNPNQVADAKRDAKQLANQNQQRSNQAAQQQQNRNAAGKNRAQNAKTAASSAQKEAEARRKNQAEAQRKEMLDEINAHSDFALQALDMNKEQLEQLYADRLQQDLRQIRTDVGEAQKKAEASWNLQRPKVIEAYNTAKTDITSMCKQEKVIAKQNIDKLKLLLKTDPPKAAQEAIAQGEKDVQRYEGLRDDAMANHRQNAERLAGQQRASGAEAYRVKMAQAARCEDATEKGVLENAARLAKEEFDRKAEQEIQDGEKRAGEEETKFNGLISERKANAERTSKEILENGKDYAAKLDEQLIEINTDIDNLEKKSLALALERMNHDIEHIDTEIKAEFERLEAEVVDAEIRAKEQATLSINSLQAMTQEQKTKARADITAAKQESTQRIKDAQWQDVQAMRFELQDAHGRIDQGLSALGMHTVKAISTISQLKGQFDKKVADVVTKLENKGTAAEQAQRNMTNAVRTDLSTIRNGYMDRAENMQASREVDAEQKAFDEQKKQEAEEAERRKQLMASLRNPAKDAETSRNKINAAKQQFATEMGYGIVPDKTKAMQAIATLSPEELKLFLADPEMQSVLFWAVSPEEQARLKEMANASTPEQIKAQLLMWSFKGGTGAGYDDKFFKSMVEKLSPAERAEIDREFKKLGGDNPGGMSVNDMIDTEAYLSGQNNRMMKAYWKSEAAAIAEETAQAGRGGWLADVKEFGQNHPWLAAGITVVTLGATAPTFYGGALDGIEGYGTNQDVYVAQRDKIRELTQPRPNATPDEIAACNERRLRLMAQIDQHLGENYSGLTLEQLDQEESSSEYNKLWMKKGDNTFAGMLDASRKADWQNYAKNKSAYGAETTLGNKGFTQQELDRARLRGGTELDDLKTFLAGRSPKGTFDSFVDNNFTTPVDRDFFKMLGEKEATPGTAEWRDQQAKRLLYAQFGGRTGWGDNRTEIEKIMASCPADQREALAELYGTLAKQYGLTASPDKMFVDALGPFKYLTAQYWLGNWSTGDLREDLKLSYGAQVSDLTFGLIGKGRAYTQLEYDLQNGKADTLEKQMARAKYMRDFDTQSGMLGTWGMGVSAKIADDRYNDLLTKYDQLKSAGLANISLDNPEQLAGLSSDQLYALSQFEVAKTLANDAAVGANAVQRGVVDGVITVVTTAVTIVATAAITIVTAGTATPFIVAALGAAAVTVAAGMTALGVKAVMLGGKYSGNDAKMDFGATVLDAVVAGVTAGNGINTFAKNIVGKLGIQSAVAQTILKELLTNGLQAGADLTKFLMDETLYQGSPEAVIAKIRKKAAQLAGSSLTSSALGVGGVDNMVVQGAVQNAFQYDPNRPFMGQFLSFANQVALGVGNKYATNLGTAASQKRWSEWGMWGVSRKDNGSLEVISRDVATQLANESKRDGSRVTVVSSEGGAVTYKVETANGPVTVEVPSTLQSTMPAVTTKKPTTPVTTTDLVETKAKPTEEVAPVTRTTDVEKPVTKTSDVDKPATTTPAVETAPVTPKVTAEPTPVKTEARQRFETEWQAKYGDQAITVYRGIRIAPDGKVKGVYTQANGEGQMVIVGNEAAATDYAFAAVGMGDAKQRAQSTLLVVMKFDVTLDQVSHDAMDPDLNHIILKPDVDITQLPNYSEVYYDATTFKRYEDNTPLSQRPTDDTAPAPRSSQVLVPTKPANTALALRPNQALVPVKQESTALMVRPVQALEKQ